MAIAERRRQRERGAIGAAASELDHHGLARECGGDTGMLVAHRVGGLGPQCLRELASHRNRRFPERRVGADPLPRTIEAIEQPFGGGFGRGLAAGDQVVVVLVQQLDPRAPVERLPHRQLVGIEIHPVMPALA